MSDSLVPMIPSSFDSVRQKCLHALKERPHVVFIESQKYYDKNI
jgi:hypothetical protein